MKTSPGRTDVPNFRVMQHIASGIEPRCSGRVMPWAMSRPCASHSAQLISIEFVRTSAIAISSTIASTACLSNSSNIGSLSSRLSMSGFDPNDDVVEVIKPGGGAGRHQCCRVILVYQQWPVARFLAVQLEAAQYRRREDAVMLAEIGIA